MNRELVIATAAIPGSMFIHAQIGSATATMTNNDQRSVRLALTGTSVVMLAAAAATGSIPTVLTTLLSVGLVFFIMRDVWQTPTLADVTNLVTGVD